MENVIEVKSEYNSLDKLYEFLKKESTYQCSKTYDSWEVRTDSNGQMEQCIVIKKSGMHAIKVYLLKDNLAKINHIIPSKLMHAYFGKNEERRQNIIEIITGKIKGALFEGAQKKAFEELEQIVMKAS